MKFFLSINFVIQSAFNINKTLKIKNYGRTKKF